MRREFIDFFNHGTLPSVGRERERERIVEFWRLPPSRGGTELRAALLIGEAGVGKSHLIEGAIRAIEAEGGATVHIKLRPEGSTSLAPLIDEGLRRSETARRISGEQAVATMREAVARLRRLCSLRRTLLVIEDAHLIAPENVREFAFLIDALRDEPLPLLIAARPQELPIRAIVEGAIREEIVVDGLSRDDLRDLWRLVFGERPTAATLRTLLDATHGNPLAIRSTLRGSIRSGSLETTDGEDRSHVTVDIGAFAEIARRSAAGVIVGMTIDLDPAERQAAERFALLGEVFAAEAAAVMVDDADRAIESLLFRGLLATSLTPTTPLDEARSARLPLAFTHTLLHDALITDPSAHVDRLVDVVASGAPLYTLRPIRLLASATISPSIDPATIIAAIDRLKRICRLIDTSSEWRHADEVFDVADHLADRLEARIDPVALRTIRAAILTRRLFAMRRTQSSDRFRELSDKLYRESADVSPDAFPRLRIDAITHRLRRIHEVEKRSDDVLMSEAFALIARHPELRTSAERIQLASSLGSFGVNESGYTAEMIGIVEREMNDMLDDPDLSESLRRTILSKLGRFLLALQTSPEEMADRRRLVERLDPLVPPDDAQYLYLRATFQLMEGQFASLLSQASAVHRTVLDQGHLTAYLLLREREIMSELLLGKPLPDCVEEFLMLEKEIERSPEVRDHADEYRRRHFSNLIVPLLLNDRFDLFEELKDRMAMTDEERRSVDAMISPLHFDDPERARREIAEGREANELERLLLSDEPQDPAVDVEELVIARLTRTPYRLHDASLDFHALRVVDYGLSSGRLRRTRPLLGAMRGMVTAWFDWFAERQTAPPLATLLKRYGGYLTADERKRRETLHREMIAGESLPFAWNRPDRLRIRAIGEFAAEGSDHAMHPLRGGRNRIALGTLIAQALLRRPLDRRRFLAQATGITDDPERARTTWNVIALRLRDALGRDVVRVDDGVPTLDTTAADVDLIAARDLLATCDRERRAGHLLAAREALTGAIDLLAGAVIFPGLYDELFETLRDDWGSRLRDAVLTLAAELTKAGDDEGVGELLEVYEKGIGE